MLLTYLLPPLEEVGVLLRAFHGGIPRGPLAFLLRLLAPSVAGGGGGGAAGAVEGGGVGGSSPSSMEYLMVASESSLIAKKGLFTQCTRRYI